MLLFVLLTVSRFASFVLFASGYAKLDEFDDEFDEDFDGPSAAVSSVETVTPIVARQNNAAVSRTDLRDSRVSQASHVIGWCRAKFKFDARDEQELSLNVGEVLPETLLLKSLQ